MRPHGRVRRKGFSVFELLVVLAVISIMVAIGVPRVRNIRDHANLRAARDQVATALTVARAAAVQKGQMSEFRLANNAVTVTLPTANQTVLYSRDLKDLYGATVTSGGSSNSFIDYDTRGFAGLGGSVTYTIDVSGSTQTVCVSKLGHILKNSC